MTHSSLNSLKQTWPTTLANDLTQQFCMGADTLLNDKAQALFIELGEALEAGHTVVSLTAEDIDFFESHAHPLIEVQRVEDLRFEALGVEDLETEKAKQFLNPKKPMIIIKQGKLAYLHRQWYQEYTLAIKLNKMFSKDASEGEQQADLSHLPSSMHAQQRKAIKKALSNQFTLITGGPGTGKTWTVAQLVLTIFKQNPQTKIALAAPTGKAAQRMQEALYKSLSTSTKVSESGALAEVKNQLESAKTIHRLLGLGYNSQPRYHENNHLPYDLVIIDEASMLGVALAGQLLSAIGEHTKLILLGDANQLAAVDAGAVLADLTSSEKLQNQHVNLTKSTRFTSDSSIGQLAHAVLAHDTQGADDILQSQDDVEQINPKSFKSLSDMYTHVWQPFLRYADALKPLHGINTIEQKAKIQSLFYTFDGYRILTATHKGNLGAERINRELSTRLKTQLNLIDNGLWFHGRPVMLTQNDYTLGLSNGDVGIALIDDLGNYYVYFAHLDAPIAANRLSQNYINTAFAMTIHKSQGSEFEQVAICMDAPKEKSADSQAASLLSCELVYTAITRAKTRVVLYADRPTIHETICTKAVRQTGLKLMLDG